MANPYAREFTPEMDASYLASLLNPIEQRERETVARARKEGDAAGLIGQAATGARIGAAEAEGSRERADTIGRFNFDVAGLNREERLTGEREAYSANEAQKTRDFQASMAKLGYDFSRGEREAAQGYEKNSFWQTLPAGIGAGILTRGLGTKLGGGR